MTEDWQQGGFGLYLHWPFCEAKCPYCDFNSHVSRRIDQNAWRAAFLSELKRAAGETEGRVLNAVFFGGGTPTLMNPDVVADIIAEVRRLWPVANDLEITLEANPSSVEAGRFRAYREAGVSRISMGIQALNDADLRRLGRLHSVDEALKAFDIARNNFNRVSFDLIYGRQGQSLLDWQTELKQALSLAIDHLSLYQLTIEQGTAFGDRYSRGKLHGLPDEDLGADMYLATQEICADMGFPRYEVSNHARPGAESRHNLIYWRYGDYIGIGPGAHGRLTLKGNKYATVAYSNPQRWLDGAGSGRTERAREQLPLSEQATEYLLMGLRLEEGIDLSRYSALAGSTVDQETIEHLVGIGMINHDGNRITVTDQGFMVLNQVIEAILPD